MWQEARGGIASLWLQKDKEQRDSWQNEPEPPEWAGDVQAQCTGSLWFDRIAVEDDNLI